MACNDVFRLLRATSYPGRGILLGSSADRKTGLAAYFIMGRSASSRNRFFEWTSDGIRTRVFDEGLAMDPSLLIYHPIRFLGDSLIVANGDQMETICSTLASGGSFADAVSEQQYEPDGPNWTPRISGIMYADGAYDLAIVRKESPASDQSFRQVSSYRRPVPGTGHFISTYASDGDPLPSFVGEPKGTALPQHTAEELAEALWQSMDQDNRVAVFAAQLDFSGRALKGAVINKHLGDELSAREIFQ